MSSTNKPTILIIEPNTDLDQPYTFLEQHYQLLRSPAIPQALKLLGQQTIQLVMLSSSFSNSKTLFFLESFKNLSTQSLTPLIYVVNLHQPISSILGTSWGNKIDILHSQSTQQQTLTSVDRLLSV